MTVRRSSHERWHHARDLSPGVARDAGARRGAQRILGRVGRLSPWLRRVRGRRWLGRPHGRAGGGSRRPGAASAGEPGRRRGLRCGFRWALSHGYDVVVQVDADGQHDPAQVQALLDALDETGADMVIGSRFVTGAAPYVVHGLRRLAMRLLSARVRRVAGLNILDSALASAPSVAPPRPIRRLLSGGVPRRHRRGADRGRLCWGEGRRASDRDDTQDARQQQRRIASEPVVCIASAHRYRVAAQA